MNHLNKLKIALTTTTMLLSALAAHSKPAFFAFSAVQDQMTTTPALMPTQCANFSGRWSGSCDSQGNSKPDAINIKQFGCVAFALGLSDFVVVNQLTHLNYDTPTAQGLQVTGLCEYPSWNKTHDKLTLEILTLNKTFGDSSQMHIHSVSGQLALIGGTLVATTTDENGTREVCRYQKR